MTNTNETNKEAEFGGSALNDGLELLPCPFCNHLPILSVFVGKIVIECKNRLCGMRPSTYRGGLCLEGASHNWNMRSNETR